MNILNFAYFSKNCGHTFDRESLQNWLIVNELCPNCRRPVDSSRALITNYTLKSLIERGNRPFSSASLREEVFEENDIDQSIDTKCLNETWATYFRYYLGTDNNLDY